MMQAESLLPSTLAIVEDDASYARPLADHLLGLGIQVNTFGSSNELLAHRGAFDFAFYLIDLMLPGVDGTELIKILRLRTSASVLVVSGRTDADVFEKVVNAGADMYLAKPVVFKQVALAIKAIQRRVVPIEKATPTWRLDRQSEMLIAPDGAKVELQAADVVILDRLMEAGGQVVPRKVLIESLGRISASEGDGLNATIFRLRRRIERATTLPVPLHAKSGVGYAFATLISAQ